MVNWWSFKPRESVAARRTNAIREGERLKSRGAQLFPVVLEGKKIAASFWGKAWCENLESYRDFEYRLPRGRSYVRNRAVLDLRMQAGEIVALVLGADTYRVQITITAASRSHWTLIKSRCAGQIGTLIELLQGRLSEQVLRIITHRDSGLFPKPQEIQMSCSCPDWAKMCKHVAATLYGVGARLDAEPELLFMLRGVDHAELIAQAPQLKVAAAGTKRKTIAADALADVFGIEIGASTLAVTASPAARARPRGAVKHKAKSKRNTILKTKKRARDA